MLDFRILNWDYLHGSRDNISARDGILIRSHQQQRRRFHWFDRLPDGTLREHRPWQKHNLDFRNNFLDQHAIIWSAAVFQLKAFLDCTIISITQGIQRVQYSPINIHPSVIYSRYSLRTNHRIRSWYVECSA